MTGVDTTTARAMGTPVAVFGCGRAAEAMARGRIGSSLRDRDMGASAALAGLAKGIA
jgi:hypothetical protein